MMQVEDSLQHLNSCLDPSISMHDRAVILIAECISLDLTNGKAIVAALKAKGLSPRHVGIMLSRHRGDDPKRFLWRRNAEGTYALHT